MLFIAVPTEKPAAPFLNLSQIQRIQPSMSSTREDISSNDKSSVSSDEVVLKLFGCTTHVVHCRTYVSINFLLKSQLLLFSTSHRFNVSSLQCPLHVKTFPAMMSQVVLVMGLFFRLHPHSSMITCLTTTLTWRRKNVCSKKQKCILTVAMDLSPTKKYFQFVFLASCLTLEHL
jgi:hypothetical protein